MASKSAINMMLKVSPQLAKITGATSASRPQTLKAVWQYINNNNLKGEKGVVRCDNLLKEAFGKDEVKHTEIMGLISKHLQK